MKRFISVFLLLAFCLSVPLVAFAAEPEEYIFEMMPPVSMLDDYDFIREATFYCAYDGVLPEGVYDVFLFDNRDLIQADSSVIISYSYDSGLPVAVFTIPFVYNGYPVSFSCTLADYTSNDGSSVLFPELVGDDSFSLPEGSYIKFVPKDFDISLTDYVSSDSLAPLLDEIVVLLPVVMVVIVGYIAIRKALQWLQGVLHNS